ncbi:sulfurtransferase [Sediminibacillus halophilus]|uniref:Thiosulfate/3-mercaptopyruvate sulfurtransferase n=1 Tax=Sediminibacillus halophilus TaxID=482461 RepID=A0A1G9X7N9_9BACI|nr:sulfurtransferase [Sediminibacillus halophilus]SDM92355.1 thiosulfate/3-mercaptopyruvate sulfurtransferase [Sediminibacillus halophilus]
MDVFVTADWLYDRIKESAELDIVVLDTRFELTDPEAGKQAYLQGHIPGAVHFDLNQDLSGEKGEHGGSHPLPEPETFAEKLGNAGIGSQTTVVIYDQGNDMFAARCWWLLTYYGHERTFLLEGGLESWEKHGYSLSREIPVPKPKTFLPDIQDHQVVDIDYVKQKMVDSTSHLIDSRSPQRYLGKTEPLYQKAGHIPGATNYFWKQVLTDTGRWKSDEELKMHFAPLPPAEEIIVSCGSGVSACPNILALQAAGYQNVKLYPGSFSDWISYPENKVSTRMDG